MFAQTAESETIAEWFHSGPSETLSYVCDRFLARLDSFGLELQFPSKDLRKLLCEATCVYCHAHMTKRAMAGPKTRPLAPKNWTPEAETCWQDYLQSVVFPFDFWEFVWSRCDTDDWEEDVPHWKTMIQFLMIRYAKRDVTVLSDAGLMFVDEKTGELMDAAEYDMYHEDYDDYNHP